MSRDENDKTDEVLRALADSTRRLIIDELFRQDGLSLFDICGRLSLNHGTHMSRQAITKHLSVLVDAGIVEVQWKGRTRMHFLNVRPIRDVGRGWLRPYLK